MVCCSVCLNNNTKGKTISFFKYPKETSRREEWLKAVGREDLIPKTLDAKSRQIYKICEEHFDKTCFKYSKNQTVKYLSETAFPTLNLPLKEGESSNQKEENRHIEIIVKEITERPTSKIISMKNNTSYNIELNVSGFEDKKDHDSENKPKNSTKRKIIELKLQESVARRRSLNCVRKEDFTNICGKYMTKGLSQIVKWQIDLKADQTGNAYSQEFITFALNLYYCSPIAYNFLSNTLCLPTTATLIKTVKPIGTKLDERLLSALKIKVDKMGPKERICTVCVNYKHMKGHLFYDITNDRIIGFREINGIQKPELAKYVVVLMIRGIIHDWEQPIAYTFQSKCGNHPEVNSWIDHVICLLLQIGFDIRAFVSDLDSDFLSASNSRSINREKSYFNVNGHKIYYIFDIPNLLKCLGQTLTTCNFIFGNKVAKWSHIRDVYKEDKKRLIKLAPKLTDINIECKNLTKMSVKLVAQVLSNNVALAINNYVNLNICNPEAQDTADFLNKINNLSNIFNSKLRYGNKFKIAFLQEMLSFFKNLKLIDRKKDVTNTVSFIDGFQVSIQSLLELTGDLQLEGIKSSNIKSLNLDCTRRFFNKFRTLGGKRQEPTCHKFSVVFKKMFIRSILKKPDGANCQEDFESLLMKHEDHEEKIEQDSTAVALAVGTNDYQFDLPEENGLIYLSGYLYRTCMNKHKCEKLQSLVSRSEEENKSINNVIDFLINPPDNFVKFIKILEQSFIENFNHNRNIINIGNEIYRSLEYYKFSTPPCVCFPTYYLKKLFIRFRIYHAIKSTNRILKTNKCTDITFRISKLK